MTTGTHHPVKGSEWLSIQVSISLNWLTSQLRCAERRPASSESASSNMRKACALRGSSNAAASRRSVAPTQGDSRSDARFWITPDTR